MMVDDCQLRNRPFTGEEATRFICFPLDTRVSIFVELMFFLSQRCVCEHVYKACLL